MVTHDCNPECQRKCLKRSREIIRSEVIEFNISYRNLLESYKQSTAGIDARDKQIMQLLYYSEEMRKYLLGVEMRNKELEQHNLALSYQKNFDEQRLKELKLNSDAQLQLRWNELEKRENALLQRIYSDNFREGVRADKDRDVATINANKSVKIEEIRANRDNYKIDADTKFKFAELEFEKQKFFYDLTKKEESNGEKEKKKIKKLNGKLLSCTDKFHTYVSGSSGGGKSEIIKTLIKHHLKSPRKAVIIIDPKNDLAEQVAKFKDNDPDRLIYIHPKLDASKTFVFNPFDLPEQFIDDHRPLIQESLLNSFEIMLDKELSDAMKAFLNPCIELILYHPNGSFKVLRSLLNGEKEQIKDRYDKKLEVFTKNYLNGTYDSTKDAIIRRLDLLLQSDFARVTTGKTTIKLNELIKENKLIIFNLKGLAHKEALGALIMAQIQSITMARHVDDIKNKTYLIIDECHNFITPSVDKILSEARSSKLFLVLANQYLKQIKRENIATSVKTNTSLKIIARQTDSITAKELGAIIEVSPDKLRVLKPKKGECYIRIESAKAILVRNKSKLIDFSYSVTDAKWNEIVEHQLDQYYVPIVDEEATTEDFSGVVVE